MKILVHEKMPIASFQLPFCLYDDSITFTDLIIFFTLFNLKMYNIITLCTLMYVSS